MDTTADITVREVMDRAYLGVSEADSLVETVELLLREEAEAAVVQRGSEYVGVVTERDVLAAIVEGPPIAEATVGDVMTTTVPTVDPDETVAGAESEMATLGTGRLVVTNGTEPLGVVSESDLFASRTYQTRESAADATQQESTTARETDQVDSETLTEQSICEGCGALSSGLASFNGQLLCPECRRL